MKTNITLAYFTPGSIFSLLLVLFLNTISYGRTKIEKNYQHVLDFYKSNYDTLLDKRIRNKRVPEKYEKEFLEAMSYFPELNDTRIEFKEAKIPTTLNTRPTILSVFAKKENRKYMDR